MRYGRAVEKLRELAEACQRTIRLPVDEPFLFAAYCYGDVLDGADTIEWIEVVLTLDLPPEQVTWGSQPPGTEWLVDVLRLAKGGFGYRWRSQHEPVANLLIREPVRFWSLDGADVPTLDALRDRRFADLPRSTASPMELRRRTELDLQRALEQLRETRDRYRDRDWRKEHRGGGRYPEHHLWEAADGYLEVLDVLSGSTPA